jgi:putative redox protein
MTAPNIRKVRVRWTGEGLAFEGTPEGGPSIIIDSDLRKGPSPTHTLLMALAACMAVDVKMILEKGRVPLESIEVEASGVRADEAPKRFTAITLTYELRGPGPEHQNKIQRALELSRDKYCSVMHSLDPSIEVELRSVLV